MPSRYEENKFFLSDFDDQMESEITVPLIEEVKKQTELTNGHIDLWINSVGGYMHLVNHYIELVEIAKRSGVVVRTMVPDMAFSAGSMLAITGTPGERYIARGAEHLIHYGQIASFETTQEQIERFTSWKKRRFASNLAHYRKYSNVPDIDKHILDDGYFVKSSDCIKWGLADKYLDKLEL